MASTNAHQLEQWLGADNTEYLSKVNRNWYGPPIAIAGVPGEVYATGDGDFIGPCRAQGSWQGYLWERSKRLRRAARIATGPQNRAQLNAGFASLQDFLDEANGGKRWVFRFEKAMGSNVAIGYSSWTGAGEPPAGAAGSAAPGGRVVGSTTTGTFRYANPSGTDTLHFAGGEFAASDAAVPPHVFLLYDRLFDVAKTMNSTATEAVTGVPTRYQSTTGGAADYIGGNFLFAEVQASLAATAHNWTVCTYLDQANAASTFPSWPGSTSTQNRAIDHTNTHQWFAPLEAGDVGVKALTQMQCSALVATGSINFVIGHPIAWFPLFQGLSRNVIGGINSAFNFARIFDGAGLAFLSPRYVHSAASTLRGQFYAIAG